MQPAPRQQPLTTNDVKVCASETAALHHWLVGLKDAPTTILVRAAKGNSHELDLQVWRSRDEAADAVARKMQWHIAALAQQDSTGEPTSVLTDHAVDIDLLYQD